MTNYKRRLELIIEQVRKDTKAGVLAREERLLIIDAASKEYAYEHAKANDEAKRKEAERAEREGRKPRELPFNPPDSSLLNELTDLAIYEELTDNASNKVARDEYPILSEIQLARRREGVHEKTGKTPKGEVSIGAASTMATDGRNYRVPTRRKRTVNENLLSDQARSRNKERRNKYEEFTKVQPVITYRIDVATGERID